MSFFTTWLQVVVMLSCVAAFFAAFFAALVGGARLFMKVAELLFGDEAYGFVAYVFLLLTLVVAALMWSTA